MDIQVFEASLPLSKSSQKVFHLVIGGIMIVVLLGTTVFPENMGKIAIFFSVPILCFYAIFKHFQWRRFKRNHKVTIEIRYPHIIFPKELDPLEYKGETKSRVLKIDSIDSFRIIRKSFDASGWTSLRNSYFQIKTLEDPTSFYYFYNTLDVAEERKLYQALKKAYKGKDTKNPFQLEGRDVHIKDLAVYNSRFQTSLKIK